MIVSNYSHFRVNIIEKFISFLSEQMHDVLALTDEDVEVPAKPANVEYWQRLIEKKKGTSTAFVQSNSEERSD